MGRSLKCLGYTGRQAGDDSDVRKGEVACVCSQSVHIAKLHISPFISCLSVVAVLTLTLQMKAALYSYPNDIRWSNLR